MPESLLHEFVVVPHKLRLVTLAAFILSKSQQSRQSHKMVVFLSTQHSVEFHHTVFENVLRERDVENTPSSGVDIVLFKLHGDMPQKERTKTFQDFCVAQSGVLFCTDVAARGLDLPHVGWIVQYNTPGSATDYIHRVGRTARIGSRGHALLFLTPSEVDYVQVLAEYKIKLTEIAMNDLLKTLMLYEAKRCMINKQKYLRPRTTEEAATTMQRRFELNVHENKDVRSLARKAFQSFVRAYAAYPSHLKGIFHVKHLHLGHVAKSFALQDAPTHIGGIVGKFGKMDTKRNAGQCRKRLSTMPSGGPPKKQKSTVSEFASGLDGVVLKSTTGKGKKRKMKKTKAAVH
ncbi:putative ATP-dependent RNA helicase DDX31 [Lamellibrachia satsuma]|nr:putative ATP-dependent RNA helicase DDX31 [Lamellibrachia satsuma]